ncbi:MAG: hypothetical protein PHZ13_04480 [bacterium]|jgi:nitrite reductase/ring-hydroxylating ferredoxin subunit|nr:hypothetical protein [bacterium]MDD3624179.1 hypothetical protein [Proteiniphilum sp.]MDD3968146.1 hypothetical protein [Proteiniphilum sp.]MDD4459289.1 hypothetical protein [Proteiniphilum sp.]
MYRNRSILFFLLAMVLSCGEEPYRNSIPFAQVNFLIDLNGPDYVLGNQLEYKILLENDRRRPEDRMGYAGLLVVAGAYGKLYAYDCCCPYEKSREIRVEPDSDGYAKCPRCGSLFVTIYGLGSPVRGPATESLQIYRVMPLQEGIFRIIN